MPRPLGIALASLAAATLFAANEPAAQPQPGETITLGQGDLLTGLPGEGPLTAAELADWLADPASHRPLDPRLPLGLAAGQASIKGLDANPLTRAKIELGRQLYFDTRLSKDDSVSCASCHSPEHGYAADTRFGVGIEGLEGERNSPTAANRILSDKQFWDGRAATLEEQAVGPIANPIEMGNTHDACAMCVTGVAGYRMQFERIFPDGVTIDNIGRALASFERAVVTGASPWDHYAAFRDFEKNFEEELEEPEFFAEDEPELYQEYLELKRRADANPISESAKRGGELFFSDASGCTQCHVGPNFTDELYHNLGVGMDRPDEQIDWGRSAVTNQPSDRGAFKTPTLRNVAQTAPYMHDGSQATLEEVVDWYADGGHKNPHLSDKMKPLKLTDQQKADLVAFMKALTGPLPRVETGRLPE
ncbi:Cytochrome c551 peroxidase precursor [Posidoniimonas corsicana]|uniref:Cytochrome c551 peroxidase n=1 Tax=Posidoniimonas corsicana TaxID=1938618 RepID=A0A5C5UYA8_9BACT|nr:cytochrome c peroxidase [Posidoniimonas corsicana]TWT30452.1 Cytochrome c551 peroxidase precursor [Posidoniimonas corsicana]